MRGKRSLNALLTAIKANYLDNKLDDEPIHKNMISVNVKTAKHQIKYKEFIKNLILSFNEGKRSVFPLGFEEFAVWARHEISLTNSKQKPLTESQLRTLFDFLLGKKLSLSDLRNLGSKQKYGFNDSRKQTNNWMDDEDGKNHPTELEAMVLDEHFNKFYSAGDSAAAYTNPKFLKTKFEDFKKKMEVWQTNELRRKKDKKLNKKHILKLREILNQGRRDFTYETEKVIQSIEEFDTFQEENKRIVKEEKIINNMLAQLYSKDKPTTNPQIEMSDVKRIADNENTAFMTVHTMLEEFCRLVREEGSNDRIHFNFYDVPDLIVRKNYKRKDYE